MVWCVHGVCSGVQGNGSDVCVGVCGVRCVCAQWMYGLACVGLVVWCIITPQYVTKAQHNGTTPHLAAAYGCACVCTALRFCCGLRRETRCELLIRCAWAWALCMRVHMLHVLVYGCMRSCMECECETQTSVCYTTLPHYNTPHCIAPAADFGLRSGTFQMEYNPAAHHTHILVRWFTVTWNLLEYIHPVVWSPFATLSVDWSGDALPLIVSPMDPRVPLVVLFLWWCGAVLYTQVRTCVSSCVWFVRACVWCFVVWFLCVLFGTHMA